MSSGMLTSSHRRWPYLPQGQQHYMFVMSCFALLLGQVWPGLTAYPDFSSDVTHEWWYDNLKRFHEKVPFDGLWIVSIEHGRLEWADCRPTQHQL